MGAQHGRGADVEAVVVGRVTLVVRRHVRAAALLRAEGKTYKQIAQRLGIRHTRVRQLLEELRRQARVGLLKTGVTDWQTALRDAVQDGLTVVQA